MQVLLQIDRVFRELNLELSEFITCSPVHGFSHQNPLVYTYNYI
jgi:hypothetical protein